MWQLQIVGVWQLSFKCKYSQANLAFPWGEKALVDWISTIYRLIMFLHHIITLSQRILGLLLCDYVYTFNIIKNIFMLPVALINSKFVMQLIFEEA